MEERRLHPRYPARWRVMIFCRCLQSSRQMTFDGTTIDISLGGMSIHSGHNLCPTRDLDLTLLIPPLQAGADFHRLQIRARANHTVLVGQTDAFRTGIEFLSMSAEDRACLDYHLETRFSPYALDEADKKRVEFAA